MEMLKHLQWVQQVQAVLCLPTGAVKKQISVNNKCTTVMLKRSTLKSSNVGSRQGTQQIKPDKQEKYQHTVQYRGKVQACVYIYVFDRHADSETQRHSPSHLLAPLETEDSHQVRSLSPTLLSHPEQRRHSLKYSRASVTTSG